MGESRDFSRRSLLRSAGGGALAMLLARSGIAEEVKTTDILQFEKTLATERAKYYRHRKVDIVKEGFRPVGGKVADFAVASLKGRFHFYYIERRLQEATPFYPGHEIFFGHASTENFIDWEVHDPVMLIRPDSWEEAHMWAPCIIRRGDEFIMAYTGVNRHISQNIGFASSTDLFTWKRWDSNPLSPCKDKPWAAWWEDHISSCRDPNIVEADGRYWLTYTANTKQGASCIAMTSTADFRSWKDHGPICVGPNTGYEARREGGHPQGSLESASMVKKRGKWFLLVKAKVREGTERSWVIENSTNESFDFTARRPFWPGAFGIETVMDRGDRTLLATFFDGYIRLGTTDWSVEKPVGRFIESEAEVAEWLHG